MFATTTTVPVAIVYLLLVFLHGYGDGSPLTADVLQDGVPAYRVSASRETDAAKRIYRIDVTAVDDTTLDDTVDATAIVRVEQSDLVGHTYLVHSPDGSSPSIVSLAGVLEQLTSVSRATDRTLDLTGDGVGERAAEGPDLGVGATLHLMRRPGVTVMSAPDSGILVLVHEE